ncbi:MAG: hypothetical protein RI986_847, partial [Planctomycetota bacterium]
MRFTALLTRPRFRSCAATIMVIACARMTHAAPQQQQLADRARQVAEQMALCPIKAMPASLDAGFVAPQTDVKFEATLLNTLDRPVKCVRSAPS